MELENRTASGLEVAYFLVEQPRSKWWGASGTLWVTTSTYINNVIGVADRDYEISVLVEVRDVDDEGDAWLSYLIAFFGNEVSAEWVRAGRWRWNSLESELGWSKSDVFDLWASVASAQLWP